MLTTEELKLASVTICNNLDTIRKENGVSQQELADKLGIEQSTVNRMLNGRFSPRLEMLIKVAEALDYRVVLEKR